MLVPMIPVKTLAKMLLILMMGPASKPLGVPKLLELTNGYYELRKPDTDRPIYFTKAQMQSILNSLSSDARASLENRGLDLNKLAAYIVSNNLSYIGSDQQPRVYDDKSSASTGPRNTVVVGATVTVNKPQNNNRKMYRDHDYTFSPALIKQLIQLGNVPALLKEQRNIDKTLKSWFLPKYHRAVLTEGQFFVDRALIDWGCLTLPLQKHCNLQKYGKKKALETQLQLAKDRLANGLRCWWHGERELKLEIYYLEKVLKDPITNFLYVIRYGEGPEASTAFDDFKRQWAALTPHERAIIEKQLNFSPVRMADFLFDHRPKIQPIIPPQQPTQPEAVTSATTDLPATGAQTTANMPTVVSSTSPQPDITSTTQETVSSSVTSMNQPTTATAATTASTASSSTASHAQSYPTTDLPATGANTSSASSLMVDNSISLDGIILALDPLNSSLSSQSGGEYDLNELLLDLVTTTRTQEETIDPELKSAIDTIFADLGTAYDPLDPQVYANALEQGLALVAQRKERAQQQEQARKEKRKELISFTNEQMSIAPQDAKDLYIFCRAFAGHLVQVPDRIHDIGSFLLQIAELAGDTMVQLIIFNKQRADNPLVIPPVDPEAKLFKLIGSCSRQGIRDWCKKMAQLTPEQSMDLKGKLAADMLFAILAQKAIGAGIRLARTGGTLHLEGRLGPSINQAIQSVATKAKNLIPAVEEAVAVTAEGVPVRIATAAEETVSLQQTANKVGGAAKAIPAILKVNNMQEFFQTAFGQKLKNLCTKTSRIYKKAIMYKVSSDIKHPMLDRGDLFYLDKVHLDHIEVFKKTGEVKGVLNLDGTVNAIKTEIAIKEGRSIPV
jgi:hypothetical protein